MLRENLDTVLKDLLEFKSSETVESGYPGQHLDLTDNFLAHNYPLHCSTKPFPVSHKFKKTKLLKEVDYKALNNTKDDIINGNDYPQESAVIISRIRRYLDKKSRKILKPVRKIKYSLQDYMHKNDLPRDSMNMRAGISMPSKHTKRISNIRKRSQYQYGRHNNVGRKLQMYYSRVKKKHGHEKHAKKTRPDPSVQKNNDPANGDAALKSRYLFMSCMNYQILEKRGHQPLLDLLELLGGWPILNQNWDDRKFNWLELMAKLRVYNNDILISEWVGPDIKNSDEFVIQFDQTSLGNKKIDLYMVLKLNYFN